MKRRVTGSRAMSPPWSGKKPRKGSCKKGKELLRDSTRNRRLSKAKGKRSSWRALFHVTAFTNVLNDKKNKINRNF